MLNFLEQADKLRCQSKFKQAAKYYALAAEKNPGYEAYYGLGDMLRMIGLYQKALQAYKKAKRFILNDALKSADIFMGRGMALRAVMEYKTAAACFFKAGEKYKLLKDPEGTAYSLWCLGGLCRIMGNPGEALKAFDQALALYKKSNNGEYVAFALCGRGGTLRILGRFKESLQCYKTANKYFTSQKDTFGRAYSNCGMGSANRMLGRYNISAALYKKAEKLYSSFKDEINYAYVLWGHANTLLCSGKYKEAGGLCLKAGRLFKKWNDKRGLVYILLQNGELERITNNKVKALGLFKKAVAISRKYGLKLEEIHGETGIYLTTQKGVNPLRKYDKFGTKWHSVLKKNSLLNFP